MWVYLAGLVWMGLIVGIVWSYRRKQALRQAAREQQFAQLLAEVKRNPSLPSTLPATAPHLSHVPRFTRKPKLLPQTQGLLYYVLRAGLPDHAIFPNQTLSDFIEPVDGPAREQHLKRLAAQRADFIICNKQLEVIAVVLVRAVGDPQWLESALRSVSIRLIQVDAAAPPKHTQVRALVYGEGGQQGA